MSADEAFRYAGIGLVEHHLLLADHLPGHAVMQHFRGQQSDAAVMVLLVVPGEESLASVILIFL